MGDVSSLKEQGSTPTPLNDKEEKVEYMGLYVLAPREFSQAGYESVVEYRLQQLLKKKTGDFKRCSVYFNPEEKDLATVLERIKTKLPSIQLKPQSPDFAKHGTKRAFLKRDQAAFRKCTHILVLKLPQVRETFAQAHALRMAEDSVKVLVIKTMHEEDKGKYEEKVKAFYEEVKDE